MRVQFLSDLHTCFIPQADLLPFLNSCKTNADIVILAGDIGVPGGFAYYDNWFTTIEFFCSNYEHVIYIPGNHEYYHSYWNRITRLLNEVKQFNGDNLHIFEDMGSITLYGTTFHCGTGWFVESNPMDIMHWGKMSDAHVIFDGNMNERTVLDKFWSKGKAAADYLLENTNTSDIVVTHHMPHSACTPPAFSTSKINSFFVNKAFTQVIEENKPHMWLHGHSHGQFNKVIDETRVIRNPFGYWEQEINTNKAFKRNMIIEL